MATSEVVLKLGFLCDDAKEHTFSFKYANASASTTNVQNLAECMLRSGSIFLHVPETYKAGSAKMVVTSETPVDIDPEP